MLSTDFKTYIISVSPNVDATNTNLIYTCDTSKYIVTYLWHMLMCWRKLVTLAVN